MEKLPDKLQLLKEQLEIIEKFGQAAGALAAFVWVSKHERQDIDPEGEIESMIEDMEDEREFDADNLDAKIEGIEDFVTAAELLAKHLIPKLREAAEKGTDNGNVQRPYGWG